MIIKFHIELVGIRYHFWCTELDFPLFFEGFNFDLLIFRMLYCFTEDYGLFS